jgi:serine/threonine protein kinase
VGNGIDESVLCMCSEYLEGGNLAQRLASGRDITRHESQRWIDRLVGALENAHGHRVVHGGLKPTAVVFDSRGAAHLTDFASSLAGDSPMAAGTHGEPDFLAPEQWDSGVVSPATDQYSLATLAYLLLTGSKPFEGQQHPNIRRQNLRRGPQPAHVEAERSGVDPLPPPVSEVLARGLSAQPADRFESVADFGEALAHALAGRRADPQVFLSYSRATCSGWASYFQTMLHNEHQIRAFVDVKRIDAAGPFPERIRQAIEACDVFVCLLASDSIASAWVRREIDEAHRLGKPMLPVFLESFSDREPSEHESDPAIRALLEFDGVFLLERKHIHVDHTLGELARIVHGTAAGQ